MHALLSSDRPCRSEEKLKYRNIFNPPLKGIIVSEFSTQNV